MAASDRFAAFDIHDATYKRINDQPIDLSVLVPKRLLPGLRPVIVQFHGGGLITGTRLFPDWFMPWLEDYAVRHSAIIVSPNYRLLPESTGLDILDDILDFWRWIERDLQPFLSALPSRGITSAQTEANLSQILSVGESAGGWLAIQSAFERPDLIKANILQYPMLDLRSPHFTQDYEKHPKDLPMLPNSVLDDVISAAAAAPGRILTSAAPPARFEAMVVSIQRGRVEELLGKDRRLYPVERVEDGAGIALGSTLIMHGEGDQTVPVDGSRRFVDICEKNKVGVKIKLIVREGDHAFDEETKLEEEWLSGGLEFVTEAWLS